MAFTLPPLPYGYDALEPNIDARTMEIHHTKHHQGYVNNLNAALEKQPILLTNVLPPDGWGASVQRWVNDNLVQPDSIFYVNINILYNAFDQRMGKTIFHRSAAPCLVFNFSGRLFFVCFCKGYEALRSIRSPV